MGVDANVGSSTISLQPCWCTRTTDKGTRRVQGHVCAVRENGEPMRTKPTPTTHYATQVLHSLTLRDTVRTLLGVET